MGPGFRRGDGRRITCVTRTPRVLFKFPSGFNFDVSPDGQRFLLIGEAPDPASAAIQVVVDWFSNLAGPASPRK